MQGDSWERELPDGSSLSGIEGSDFHVHNTGFGVGHLTDQTIPEGQPGRHFASVNNFNRDLDELLPPGMQLRDLGQ